MLTAFSRVLWFLRLALLVTVVAGVTAFVIGRHQPGNAEMIGYGIPFGFYWLEILIPLDLALQVIVAVSAARRMRWAALRSFLLDFLVDVCIVVVFVATFGRKVKSVSWEHVSYRTR